MKCLVDKLTKLKEEISFVHGNLLVLIISWIFFHFVSSMTFPYESLYIKALGASAFVIGLIYALGQIVLFVSRIMGGYIADRYGRRDIIVVMTFGIAFSYVFYALAPDWRLIAIGIIFSNLCLLYQPALQAVTADSLPPEKRGLGYAMTNVFPAIPAIFAPLLARELIKYYGFLTGMRLAYWVAVLGSLGAAIIRLLGLKETLKTRKKLKVRELLLDFKKSVIETFDSWRVMSKQLKIFATILLISLFEEPIFHIFMSLYAVDVIGITKPDWAFLSVVWSSVTIIVGLPLGKIVDVIGRKKSLVLTYIIWLPLTIYFILCRSLVELILIFGLFAFGDSLFIPSTQALIADLTPREIRGRIMTIIGNLNLVAAALASIIAGFLYNLNPTLPFVVCIGTDVLILLLILTLLKEPMRREI